MRGAMPSEESVIVLMAKTAIDKSAYHRALPGIDQDKKLFPKDNTRFLDLINH
jgi:putative transposase